MPLDVPAVLSMERFTTMQTPAARGGACFAAPSATEASGAQRRPYALATAEEALAVVKFFTPWTGWTWYASEYDAVEKIFFGVVVGQEREMGYFSLDELESIQGPAGLRIERDLYWTPRALKECR